MGTQLVQFKVDTLTAIRYYLLLGIYAIAVSLLLIAAFIGIEFLYSGGWALSDEYLARVLGFGIGGLVLLIGAMIVGNRWQRTGRMLRPYIPYDQYKLLLVAVGSGVLLIASLLTTILTVGFSVGTLGMVLLVPFTIFLLPYSLIRFAYRFREDAKSASIPVSVTIIFICLAVLLYWTNSRIDFGFRWRLSGYEDVVRLVERGELRPNAGGFATLPDAYRWLSDGGDIVIIDREDLMSVIFFTQVGVPGEYYAVAYRSTDTVPQNFRDDRCDRGGRVQANIPNWYDCISARIGID